MASASGLSVISEPGEILASQNDRMRETLGAVPARTDHEGLDGRWLEDSRELFEEHSIEPS